MTSDAAGSPYVRATLDRHLAGELSREMTLMHLVLALGDAAAVIAMLRQLGAAAATSPLLDLLRVAEANAAHLQQAAALVQRGLTALPHGDGDALAAIAAQFDRAVGVTPEAAVALYSLGSSDILAKATEEIAAQLRAWDIIGHRERVLDIGCGIGRLERALAPFAHSIVGIDVSSAMIAEARRRCGDVANATFRVSSGRDLSDFADHSIDVILAIDVFPYLFAASPAIAERHVEEAARVLDPGGHLIIMNYSYRGDVGADVSDVARLARRCALQVERCGTRDLRLWDGVSYVLAKPGQAD